MISRWRWLLAPLLLVLAADAAFAHPHAWIDLRSRVLLDDESRVHALELTWLFDDYYTVLVAEELQAQGQPSQQLLDEVAKRNLANLRDYDYFTVVTYEGERQAIADVAQYETELRDGRLWMRFQVPLKAPLDPLAGALAFSVYDPTYWIEMLHLEGEPILFSGEGADRCLGEIIQPNPTLEQVTLAAALDKDETAGDGLGELFAETVVVSCS